MNVLFCNKTKIFLYYFQIKSAKKNNFFLVSFFYAFFCCAQAQIMRIEIAPLSVALNEPVTITVEIEDEEITNYPPFPDLVGFKKVKNGLSFHNSEASFQGKKHTIYTIEQVYHPLKVGVFLIKPFEMLVNKKICKSAGANINIKPFDKLKGALIEPKPDNAEAKETEKKIIEVTEDAFLALDLNKREVFVGEGISVSLSLYVSTTNRAPMQYTELNKQIEELTKKLKPATCWEENFHITEIPDLPEVTFNDKKYFQNKFYEAVFFPLNTQSITFPAISLSMKVKKKIKPNENINEFKEGEGEINIFRSEPQTVQVKPLPAHPLRDRVAVGKFFLQENVPYRPLKTGEGVNYYFKITGEGYIAGLPEPQMQNRQQQLLIYSPNAQSYTTHDKSTVTGSTVFEYAIVPQEAGEYALKNYFEWVFFNLATQRYDTLRPLSKITVSGESYKGAGGYDQKTHPLYKKMNAKIETFSTQDTQNYLWFFNALVGIFTILLFLFGIKRKKK